MIILILQFSMKPNLLLLICLLCSCNLFAILPITGPSVVCQGSTVSLTDGTPAGTWTSSNIAMATVGATTGIVSGVAAGTVTITYTVGAAYVTTLLTINPLPALSSSITPPYLCDSTIFNYTPTSSTIGTVFAWTRAAISGIPVPASSGMGNPNEQLINTTPLPIGVIYVFTLTAGGCSNTATVTVTVNPAPTLSSTLTPSAICDTSGFHYNAASITPGTVFSWSRPAVSGILPATSFGAPGLGVISDSLSNTTPNPIVVTYYLSLSISGCANYNYNPVTVTVNPCSALLQTVEPSETTFRIFPNPTRGLFTIGGLAKGASLELFNATGQIVYRQLITGSEIETIDISDKAYGIYYIRLKDSMHSITSMILKQ